MLLTIQNDYFIQEVRLMMGSLNQELRDKSDERKFDICETSRIVESLYDFKHLNKVEPIPWCWFCLSFLDLCVEDKLLNEVNTEVLGMQHGNVKYL